MEKNKFEELDQIICSKNYTELNKSEKSLVDEVFSNERAFERYRELIGHAVSVQTRPVSKQSRVELMSRFKAKNRSVVYSLLSMKVPAMANVAFLIIFFAGFWWYTVQKEPVIESPKVVYLPGKVDTVFSQLPADTVYIERIVKQQVPVYVASQRPESPAPEVTRGSTLADQEDLTDFLVSSL
ncbi:hypothetical protein [Marinoscillum sp.]|uniref:hypothetical protein n=1 Tax=Marinoscillum sp. TaxID=2024838 RepID=UPI003BAD96DD